MKYLGPFLIFIGVAGFGFWVYDFFTAEFAPKYFWAGFVSIPIIFAGSILSMPAIQRSMLKQNGDIIREQID
ncbi:hypothetical protein [Metabacillus sp. RGM 3146]|uniref:hypothetical protein n=1 Tax=Metabacillus sp. RGM 3146 TaxID=3401092 RepID=UPI003B9A806B